MMDRVILRNLYALFPNTKGVNQKPLGYVLAIAGDMFVMPAHYWSLIMKYVNTDSSSVGRLYLVKDMFDQNEKFISVPLINLASQVPMKQDKQNDTWFFRVRGSRPHRDITSSFITRSELDSIGNKFKTSFQVIRNEDGDREMKYHEAISMHDTTPFSVTEASYRDYFVSDIPTIVGDCGMPYFIDQGSFQGRIVGFHNAIQSRKYPGDRSLALGVTLYQEDVIERLTQLKVLVVKDELLEVQCDPEVKFDLEVLGEMETPVHLPTKTSWKRSDLYGFDGPSLRAPAVLTKTDGKHPMTEALKRFGGVNYCVPQPSLDLAVSEYSRLVNGVAPKFPREIFSFEQACAGIAGNPFVNGLDRKTSPGVPWCNLSKLPGKKAFFWI